MTFSAHPELAAHRHSDDCGSRRQLSQMQKQNHLLALSLGVRLISSGPLKAPETFRRKIGFIILALPNVSESPSQLSQTLSHATHLVTHTEAPK